MRHALLAALLPAALALPAAADETAGPRYTGEIVDRSGLGIGSVSVFDTESGVVRVHVTASGLPEGGHGMHFHEVGVCEGDFSSAGGHIAGDAEHGLVAGGPHPGDLPNAFAGPDGGLTYEAFNHLIDLDGMLGDADGAALVIHADPDDYVSQPAGASGDRIACAVLVRGEAG